MEGCSYSSRGQASFTVATLAPRREQSEVMRNCTVIQLMCIKRQPFPSGIVQHKPVCSLS
jgi:hypothetical protein